jgi:hypothetical protein
MVHFKTVVDTLKSCKEEVVSLANIPLIASLTGAMVPPH